MRLHRIFCTLMCAAILAGCQNPNDVALAIGAPPKNAVDLRSFETRRFNSKDAPALLAAATATLQDLGYTITESAPDAGVLAASKQRDAKETAEVAGQIILTVALLAMGVARPPIFSETQSIHVTFVVSPVTSGQQEARVSFDRYLTNNQGKLWRTELIMDPKIYREFYEKLDAGVAFETSRT